MKRIPLIILFSLFLFSGCKNLQRTVKSERPVEIKSEPETVPQDVLVEPKVDEPEKVIAEEEIIPAPVPKKEKGNYPKVAKEFRAAWVASVANINWPSKAGLTSQQQQQEAIALLDFLKENNFNAVILQVRPQADALYESQLEPWSYFLTGQQGKAPEPFYDPLNFWIEAAHDRGLELHAWLNPYRAHHSTGKEVTDKSIVKTKPELVVQLQNKMWWMDPSKEATKKHSTDVVMDLVQRYDLDGIHFDDYFYPYAEYNGGKDFPDEKSWQAYKAGGGKLSRSDWRREGVNSFISNLYEKIKAEKPHVKFGISPFGIWRPGYPASIKGFDQYEQLYADAKLWLNKGWIDYFTPQLYWPINQPGQSFPVLLGWWDSENTEKRHLWPGINAGLGEKDKDETLNQIMISRGMLPASPGVVHWSIGPLLKNPELTKAVAEGPYLKPAIVPASPWLDDEAPEAPVAVPEAQQETLSVTWVPSGEEEAFRYVFYFRYGNEWKYQIMNRKDNSVELPLYLTGTEGSKTKVRAIAVTAVDRTGNESEFKEILIN